MDISLRIIILLFFIYSFLGWFMEVCVALHDENKLINRGFLIGPYCPIYGVGVLLIMLLLHKYADDPFVLFIMAVLLCSILEYFTGYIMEKLFKARWWDYSHKKFNINGRICLDNLLAFGILGLLVMYVLNPFFISMLSKMNEIIMNIVVCLLLILFVVDLCISLKIISGFKNITKSIKKDNTEEITRKVKEMLLNRGGLYRRLVTAFNFEASEKLIRDFTLKVKNSASKAISRLEKEKDKKIEQVMKEYNSKINKIKKSEKKETNKKVDG